MALSAKLPVVKELRGGVNLRQAPEVETLLRLLRVPEGEKVLVAGLFGPRKGWVLTTRALYLPQEQVPLSSLANQMVDKVPNGIVVGSWRLHCPAYKKPVMRVFRVITGT